jgi:hypothetical protein
MVIVLGALFSLIRGLLFIQAQGPHFTHDLAVAATIRLSTAGYIFCAFVRPSFAPSFVSLRLFNTLMTFFSWRSSTIQTIVFGTIGRFASLLAGNKEAESCCDSDDEESSASSNNNIEMQPLTAPEHSAYTGTTVYPGAMMMGHNGQAGYMVPLDQFQQMTVVQQPVYVQPQGAMPYGYPVYLQSQQ